MNTRKNLSGTGVSRPILILLGAILIFVARPAFAQNNILYVSPRISSAKSNDISRKIEGKITQKIPLVKAKVGFFTYSDQQKGQEICYNKIRASSVKYLLKLDNITDAGSSYELKFSLSKVNLNNLPAGKLFEENKINWENATYMMAKNANDAEVIDQILQDVNDEVDYYFKNNKFRSRIYINPDDFEPAKKDFYATFIDWLEEEINGAEHSSKLNYIVYFDDKPYPQEASYILFGKFSAPDQAKSEVQFFVIKNNKPYKSRPVQIYVEDFEYSDFKHINEYKQEVINKIYDLLSKSD